VHKFKLKEILSEVFFDDIIVEKMVNNYGEEFPLFYIRRNGFTIVSIRNHWIGTTSVKDVWSINFHTGMEEYKTMTLLTKQKGDNTDLIYMYKEWFDKLCSANKEVQTLVKAHKYLNDNVEKELRNFKIKNLL
jgi:hypothetical protein